MNMSDVATWGQLISSAAVLVTLIYLSIQTKQTATLLRSESRQSLIQTDMEILGNQIEFPEITLNWDKEGELTLEQKHRLWSFLHSFMRSREHQWLQYQSGVLDQATWASYQGAISLVIGSDRCRAWWKTFGRPFYDPAFAETVDAFLEGQTYSNFNEQILAWK